MKLATFVSLAVLVLGLGVFQDLQAQTLARYDLQLVEVSNSGTFLDAKVQIRSAGVDFQLFNANLIFAFSPTANFGAATLLKRYDNFDNTLSSNYVGMTCTQPFAGKVSLNISHNEAPFTTVSKSWMDVAIVRLPIIKATGTYALTWCLPSATNIDLPRGSTQVYQYTSKDQGTGIVMAGNCVSIKGSLNPFDLLAFTARMSGRQVQLNWTTGPDSKVKSFDVERTAKTNVWTKIGSVDAGLRSSTAAQTFAYTDNDISGMNSILYRLKMTDANGDAKYSSQVKVLLSNVAERPQLLASFPNPFNPTTTVRFTVPGGVAVTVTIFDAAGKEVMRLYNNEVLEAGDYSKTFNGTDLASGKYLLRMVAGDYIATENLILNK
jgi:hypothetical protein